MLNLDKLLQFFFGNQSAAARVLGINRGTLRTSIAKGKDFIIVNGTVYKSVGKANFDDLKETDRLRLEEQFTFECGGEG